MLVFLSLVLSLSIFSLPLFLMPPSCSHSLVPFSLLCPSSLSTRRGRSYRLFLSILVSKCGIQQGFYGACGGAESAPVCRDAGCIGEMMRRLAGSSQKPPPSASSPPPTTIRPLWFLFLPLSRTLYHACSPSRPRIAGPLFPLCHSRARTLVVDGRQGWNTTPTFGTAAEQPPCRRCLPRCPTTSDWVLRLLSHLLARAARDATVASRTIRRSLASGSPPKRTGTRDHLPVAACIGESNFCLPILFISFTSLYNFEC